MNNPLEKDSTHRNQGPYQVWRLLYLLLKHRTLIITKTAILNPLAGILRESRKIAVKSEQIAVKRALSAEFVQKLLIILKL